MCAIDDAGQSYCWGGNNNGQVGDKNNTRSGTLTDTGNCAGGATRYPTIPAPAIDFPDVLQPAATLLTYPTDNIFLYPLRTILKTAGSSATNPNRVFSWSSTAGTSSVSHSRRLCGSTGGQSGGGVNKYEGTTTLTYSQSYSIPTAPLYNAAGGTTLDQKQLGLASGNAFDGLFCAMTGPDLYCDAHTTSNVGQTGSNIALGTAIPAGPQHVYMDGWLLGKTILDIEVGGSFACVSTDQGVGCWGYNASGQLGDGSITNRNVPVAVDVGSGSDLGQDATISSNAVFNNPISF